MPFPRTPRILPAFRGSQTLSQRDRRTERKYLRFAGLGIQFAVALLLFTLAGVWLDGKFEGLKPLFTILGLMLGFAGATTSLYFQVFGRGKNRDE